MENKSELFTLHTNYADYEGCWFDCKRYSDNGNLCLRIFDRQGPICTCTINMGVKLPDDRICIKNYSENDGMDMTLMEMGILDELVDHACNNYIVCPVYTLSEKGKEIFKDLINQESESTNEGD